VNALLGHHAPLSNNTKNDQIIKGSNAQEEIMQQSASPFDMDELLVASGRNGPPPPEPVLIEATDGVKLALRSYQPPESRHAVAALIFYHGGGAYSAGGYFLLARALAEQYNIIVYTPDLRGHGNSGGPRGDSPKTEQVFEDVNSVFEHVLAQMGDLNLPVYLGGHSSGAGLVLNYATKTTVASIFKVSGYILVAPQLGPHAQVGHDKYATNRVEFAKVTIYPFILNALFGIMGHYPAVKFEYPKKILEEHTQLVPFNTVNMANAVSPTNPKEQLEQLVSDTERGAVGMWLGDKDELFDITKMTASYFPRCAKVAGASHLGILVGADEFIGPWLMNEVLKFGVN